MAVNQAPSRMLTTEAGVAAATAATAAVVVTGLTLAGGVLAYGTFRPTPPATSVPIPSDCPAAMTTTSDGSGGTILALAAADGTPFTWQVGSTIELLSGTFTSPPFGWTLSPDGTLLTAANADLLGTQVDVQLSPGAVGTAIPLGLEGKACPLTFTVQSADQQLGFVERGASDRYLRGTALGLGSSSTSHPTIGMGSTGSRGGPEDYVMGAAGILVLFFAAWFAKRCRAPASSLNHSRNATAFRDNEVPSSGEKAPTGEA